jgi:hypothetical protein
MSEAGEIYKVPIGLKLQCGKCRKVLESTAEKQALCWIEHDDDSAVLCLSCVSKRQRRPIKVGPSEHKPKRAHRRTDWMEFD